LFYWQRTVIQRRVNAKIDIAFKTKLDGTVWPKMLLLKPI